MNISILPCRKIITEKPSTERSLLKNSVLEGHNRETQCCKVITLRQKILVPLELQYLRLQAEFGKYFMLEAYFDVLSLYLVEKRSKIHP